MDVPVKHFHEARKHLKTYSKNELIRICLLVMHENLKMKEFIGELNKTTNSSNSTDPNPAE